MVLGKDTAGWVAAGIHGKREGGGDTVEDPLGCDTAVSLIHLNKLLISVS